MMKTKKGVYVYIIVVAILVIVGFFRNNDIRKKVAHNPHYVACAHIDRVYSRRGSMFCELTFRLRGKLINLPGGVIGEFGISDKTYQKFIAGNPYFLIVFQENDPMAAFALESDKDFQDFNIISLDTVGIVCR